ncbi:hypothetical protein FOXYSP1_07517 [Fusarium oxysporum f. sp. phaseoli]
MDAISHLQIHSKKRFLGDVMIDHKESARTVGQNLHSPSNPFIERGSLDSSQFGSCTEEQQKCL